MIEKEIKPRTKTTVRMVYEAVLDVDIFYDKGLTRDELYELAEKKAAVAPSSDFHILNQIKADIINTEEKVNGISDEDLLMRHAEEVQVNNDVIEYDEGYEYDEDEEINDFD